MPLDLPLTHGGAIQASPGRFAIVDHLGLDLFMEVDDDTLAKLFGFTERYSNGINNVNSGIDVVISWVSLRNGDCWMYAHTLDRSQALAPLYITAGERALLAHRSV